ncbi:MAG: biotin transporter BioY [Clostridia bacterium]|nr:biotin transporter BioY [Clostridia bacterium]
MSEMTKNRENIRLLTRAGLLCAVLCVLAIISIPTGAVPFTLGLVGVYLCGMLLPPVYAIGSVLAYLAIGVIGVPVFSGMQSGPGVLFGVTGGFLWAYPVMAWLIAMARTKIKANTYIGKFLRSFLAAAVSLVFCYAFGAGWFSVYLKCDVATALAKAVIPFIGFDLCKAILASLISLRVQK